MIPWQWGWFGTGMVMWLVRFHKATYTDERARLIGMVAIVLRWTALAVGWVSVFTWRG